MKRVGCLYRVSTKKQTYNNDIPVQKKACRKFINKKEKWILTKEYIELGVSGYKLSESKRDALQDIKRDVLNKEIDILLVFMFDRIGRREDETPFVVKWLIDQGIEIWSVEEGQREIRDNYDRLLNYITYWQAEGESEKISIRARERRKQLVKDGIYLGYYAPYGYQMVDSDLYSKVGKKRKIPIIYEKEAQIVEMIYILIAIKKYGTDKVAIFLNKKGIKRRKEGCLWDSNMIIEIVRNPINKGYVSFGKRKIDRDGQKRLESSKWTIADKRNPDIAIVSEEIWQTANDLLDNRSRKGKRVLRLLSGYTRCGYCGNHIVPKGKTKYCYMKCKGKQKTGSCEYYRNYRVDVLESIVIKTIKEYLDTYRKVDLKNEIIKRVKRIKRREEKLRQLKQKISCSENRLIELKTEIVAVLMSGEQTKCEKVSKDFDNEMDNLKILKEQLVKLENEIYNNQQAIDMMKEYIPKWSEEFEIASLEDKRDVLNKMIEKIYLYNDRVEISVKYPIIKMLIKENV